MEGWIGGRVGGWRKAWMCRSVGEYLHEWMDDGCINGWMSEWMDGLMNGGMKDTDGWRKGQMDGCTDGWMGGGGGKKSVHYWRSFFWSKNELKQNLMEPGSLSSGCSRGGDLLRLSLEPEVWGLGGECVDLGPGNLHRSLLSPLPGS